MSKSLEYAGNELIGARKGRTGPWNIFLLSMTGLAIAICAKIEILNWREGFYLPRDFSTDSGTWRSGVHDPLLMAVSSIGLLQYPLVGFLLVANVVQAVRESGRDRIVFSLAFIATAACGALMIYRGYFTSLGW